MIINMLHNTYAYNYLLAFIFCISLCNTLTAQQSFASLDDLFTYTEKNSKLLKMKHTELMKAKKAKIAAILGVFDPTVNNKITYKNNLQLPVTLFPAEILGGPTGTFTEIETGVQHNTAIIQNVDIKLLNLGGWKNLKLSKINIGIQENNLLAQKKNLYESIAQNYYNILNLQKQYQQTVLNLAASDTLLQISQQKFAQVMMKVQILNDAKVNKMNQAENLKQLGYAIEQYTLSLKVLWDIAIEQEISLTEVLDSKQKKNYTDIEVMENNLNYQKALYHKYFWMTTYTFITAFIYRK